MFDYLENFLKDTDSKAIYVLAMICIAMTLDFLSGTLAAKVNKEIEFKSKMGINGILRKIASIALLLFFIPLAPLIPGGVGEGLLYILYIGYLIMEIKSILENYKKMDIATDLFEEFIEKFKNKNEDE